MNLPSSLASRRPAALIFLHWTTLALVVAAFGLVLFREGVDEKALRLTLINLHRSVGLLVALIAVARIGVRIALRPLLPVVPATPVERFLATAVHIALYLLMLALPVLGWALSSANGKPVFLFGLGPLPPLVERDEDLADMLAEYHELAARFFAGLVAAHAAAALLHHCIKRDGVLRAMLPPRH